MAANPALVRTAEGELVPAPFVGEWIALRRDAIDITLDGVNTTTGKWSARGTLFLTNMRLVFVAAKTDPSGLVAFELPLAYVDKDKFNQPIFGCNNLSGLCWPAMPGGGPRGSLPPHSFVMYFKEGGCGTFLPLYFRFLEYRRAVSARAASGHRPPASAAPPASIAVSYLNTAFVDPNDPSKLYLAQPVDDTQRLPEQPKYAPNYGQDEKYEDMHLRP